MHRDITGGTAGTSEATVQAVQRTSLSVWQTVNTLVPFFGLLYLMYRLLPVSYLWVFAVAVVAAGFLVRIFIIQHDCGHGSFLKSRKANDRLGRCCSLLTMVPYSYWKRQHQLHHATTGNLDKRGHGDMDIYTVEEYLRLTPWQRFGYRAYRNPLVFLLLGPLVLLLWMNRFAFDKQQSTIRQRRGVHLTNLAIGGILLALGLWIGFWNLFLIAAPVLFFAGGAGIWLFYIQHQFEHTYWKRGAEWNSRNAALRGSSYYKLPTVLRWFTGNIGFHHIHHLTETTPNYRLPQVYAKNPQFQDVYTVTLVSSLKTAFLSVWDEEQDRLISFRELRQSGKLWQDSITARMGGV